MKIVIQSISNLGSEISERYNCAICATMSNYRTTSFATVMRGTFSDSIRYKSNNSKAV